MAKHHRRSRRKHRAFRPDRLQIWAREHMKNAGYHETVVFCWLNERDQQWERQHVWGCYIMDCWHRGHRACVEIDGPYHAKEGQSAKDAKRDAVMKANGIKVIRVTHDQIDDGSAFIALSEALGYEWSRADYEEPMRPSWEQ